MRASSKSDVIFDRFDKMRARDSYLHMTNIYEPNSMTAPTKNHDGIYLRPLSKTRDVRVAAKVRLYERHVWRSVLGYGFGYR